MVLLFAVIKKNDNKVAEEKDVLNSMLSKKDEPTVVGAGTERV